jgi:hypothetical protein
VIGLGRLLIIDQMTTDAGRGHRPINPSLVALRACDPRMAGGKREQRCMVELRAGPA